MKVENPSTSFPETYNNQQQSTSSNQHSTATTMSDNNSTATDVAVANPAPATGKKRAQSAAGGAPKKARKGSNSPGSEVTPSQVVASATHQLAANVIGIGNEI